MAKKIIKAQMKQRLDTKANWAAQNPVLLAGELGVVSDDPNLYKVGDGATAWNALPFRGFDGTLVHTTGDSETAAMSQKGVTEKLTELSAEIGGVDIIFGKKDFSGKNKGFFKSGDVILVVSDDRYMISDYISVNSGDTLIYEGATSPSYSMMGVVCYDANKNFLPNGSLAFGELVSDKANEITIPNGVSFVRFSASQAGDFVGVYKYSRFDKKVDDIKATTETELTRIAKEVSDVNLMLGIQNFPYRNQGFHKNANGIRIVDDDRYMISDYISVNSGDTLIYEGATSSSYSMMGVVYCDADKNYLPNISLAFGELVSNKPNEITIPNGVSYVRFSASQAGDFVGVYKYSRFDVPIATISEVEQQAQTNKVAIDIINHNGIPAEYDIEAERVNDEAINYDCDFRFLVFTDSHSLDAVKYRTYKDIMSKGVIDMTLGLGDYNPYEQMDRGVLKREISKVLTYAGRNENDVYCVGNHEYMASYDWINRFNDYAANQPRIANDFIFTKREMFEMTTRHLANRAVFNENDPYGCYYYLDYEPQKIRVIVLNSSDIYESDGSLQHYYYEMMMVQQAQLSWYAEKALDFSEKDNPSEWSVMVAVHHYYHIDAIPKILAAAKKGERINRSWGVERRKVYDESQKRYVDDRISGEDGIVRLYVDKDYSQQGPINVIGIFHGHTHNDVTREVSGIKAFEFVTDNDILNHQYVAPLNYGLAAGTYNFTTLRGQKFQFTLESSLPNARAIGYNGYFDNHPTGRAEVYIYDEKGQVIMFWDNMIAQDSVTGTTLSGFVDAEPTNVSKEKCQIVCIDKDTKTVKCFPYGGASYREIKY